MRRWAVMISILAVVSCAVVVLFQTLRPVSLDHLRSGDIRSITAFLGNCPGIMDDLGPFDVADDDFDAILDLFKDAIRLRNTTLWPVLGTIQVTTVRGKLIETELFFSNIGDLSQPVVFRIGRTCYQAKFSASKLIAVIVACSNKSGSNRSEEKRDSLSTTISQQNAKIARRLRPISGRGSVPAERFAPPTSVGAYPRTVVCKNLDAGLAALRSDESMLTGVSGPPRGDSAGFAAKAASIAEPRSRATPTFDNNASSTAMYKTLASPLAAPASDETASSGRR